MSLITFNLALLLIMKAVANALSAVKLPARSSREGRRSSEGSSRSRVTVLAPFHEKRPEGIQPKYKDGLENLNDSASKAGFYAHEIWSQVAVAGFPLRDDPNSEIESPTSPSLGPGKRRPDLAKHRRATTQIETLANLKKQDEGPPKPRRPDLQRANSDMTASTLKKVRFAVPTTEEREKSKLRQPGISITDPLSQFSQNVAPHLNPTFTAPSLVDTTKMRDWIYQSDTHAATDTSPSNLMSMVTASKHSLASEVSHLMTSHKASPSIAFSTVMSERTPHFSNHSFPPYRQPSGGTSHAHHHDDRHRYHYQLPSWSEGESGDGASPRYRQLQPLGLSDRAEWERRAAMRPNIRLYKLD